jgi:hypothetical protein
LVSIYTNAYQQLPTTGVKVLVDEVERVERANANEDVQEHDSRGR